MKHIFVKLQTHQKKKNFREKHAPYVASKIKPLGCVLIQKNIKICKKKSLNEKYVSKLKP